MIAMPGGIRRASLQWIELLKLAGFEEMSESILPRMKDEEGVVEAIVAADTDGATSKDMVGSWIMIPSGFSLDL